MQSIIPYLVFPGTCREAMAFYSSIFNGEITVMQTFGESPIEVSDEQSNRIFNSELKSDLLVIKASDNLPAYETKTGNHISLYLTFANQADQENAFQKLADKGKVLFPINNGFGMLSDRYGVQWMLVYKG
jgi:PhnB protein